MPDARPRPVVLFAFAADADDARNPTETVRRLAEAMTPAAGCDVVRRYNVPPDRVPDLFREFGDRVAVFHYVGPPAAAEAAGLAAFLGRQGGLRLVFLDRCSTELQAQALLADDVPAVVATPPTLDDQLAIALAARFYEGLAGGASIGAAFRKAAGAVPPDPTGGRSPWSLAVSPPAAADWGLSEAGRHSPPLSFGIDFGTEGFESAVKPAGGGLELGTGDFGVDQPRSLPAAAGPTATCHFLAEMDSQVPVRHTATIEVQISREAIAAAAGKASAGGSGAVSTGRKLIVQVLPKKNYELVDEGRAEIDPPAPGVPQTLYFDVRATDVGDGEVWVVARQGQVPVVTLILRPSVVAEKVNATGKAAATAVAPEPVPLTRPLQHLYITEQENAGRVCFRFELELPDLEVRAWECSRPLVGDRVAYVQNLYKRIEDRWLTAKADAEEFAEELRAYGLDLLNQLVPPKVQQELWKHRESIRGIQVISEEPFIPWELVHLAEPGRPLGKETRFLGQMGLVRWLYDPNISYPPRELTIRPGAARFVIPDYPAGTGMQLPEAQKERAFLAERFAAAPVEADAGTVRKLIASPGGFDLLHFACHGEADPDDIGQARLLMAGRVEAGKYVPSALTASVVEGHADLVGPDGNRPVVVLNACQVGRAGYSLTNSGGLAKAFLARGAGLFLGTHWAVGDRPARTFTETFYAALLAGRTVAEAATAAREAARTAGEATWLAYVVYGHPDARLNRSAT